MLSYFIFKTFIIGMIFMYLVYFIGHMLSNFILSGRTHCIKQLESVFFKVSLGLFFSVFLMAIILTNCKTAFVIPVLGILLTIFIFFRQKKEYYKNIEFKITNEIKLFSKGLFIIFPIIWLFIFWKSFSLEYFPFFNISRDDIYYAQVAYHIKTFGIENQFLNWGVQSYKLGIFPYHYFEAYLINIFSLTGLNNNQILLFICFPILLSILTFGFLAFSVNQTFNIILTFSIALIISQLFYFDFKYVPYEITALLASLLYLKRLYRISILMLLLFPVINFGQLPLLLLFLMVLSLYLFWNKKYYYFRLIIFIILMTLLYFLPSKVISGSVDLKISNLGFNSIIDYYLTDLNRIKTSVHITISLLIEIIVKQKYLSFVLLIAMIWVFLYSNSSIYKKWLKILVLVLAMSLIASGVLSFIAETAQIFYLFYSFLILVPILIFIHFFTGKKVAIYVFAICAVFILWTNFSKVNPRNNKLYFEMEKYSIQYLKNISKNINDFKGVGGRFINPAITSAYAINSDCHVEGYQLTFLRNGLNIHTLNILEINSYETLHDFFNYNKSIILESNYFYKEFNSVRNIPWKLISQSEKTLFYLEFIKKHNINYILVNKEAIVPKEIVSLYSYRIEDCKSGEYILFNKSY